jgi:ATP-dependent Clp protease ATP-binding subunit ClpA
MNRLPKDLDLKDQLASLQNTLETAVIGQTKAITAILGSVTRYQAGLHDNKRPIGSFLFLGPTGVGKTFTVEKFAELTQPPESYIKIDCSEYSQEHDVSKLLGSPPGYVGHDNGSFLTKAIGNIKEPEKGFILLLDEIEKAHPRFFDLFLQILDSGILTDSKGNKLDFTKSLIFFTSNIGAQNYGTAAEMGFRNGNRETMKAIENRVDGDLKKSFKPEFLNRLSGRVYFQPLDKVQQLRIFNTLIADLNARLGQYYVRVKVGESLHKRLFELGFSPEYGARELKRSLINLVEQPLSYAIVSREVGEDSMILADLDEQGETVFKRLGDFPILLEEVANS